MLKKTITYSDYNGSERTEDFYFNLNKAEIMEMQITTEGGLTEWIKKIVAAQDYPTIYKVFKDIVLKAYGVKSLDGKHFRKVDDNGCKLSIDFEQTEAFSVLVVELATDAKAATEFVNGIVPADVNKQTALASN